MRRVIQSVCLAVFLILFFYVCWPYGSREYGEWFSAKEIVDAELFLVLDPLVSISTAIAGRMWVWSLWAAFAAIGLCMVFPRCFCGYVCPLGTVIDVFDWGLSRRVKLFRLSSGSWWVNIKYYVLAAVVMAAVFGVLLSGFVSAIVVLTRAMLFIFGSAQVGVLKGWYLVPEFNAGHYFSIALFLLLLCCGFLQPRFWCKYICPTGAVFSLGSIFRLKERRVSSECVNCGKCAKVCSFAAVREDFSTRHLNCAYCQSCGAVCPVDAIDFKTRWSGRGDIKQSNPEAIFSRRSVIAGIAGAAAVGMGSAVFAGKSKSGLVGEVVVRPPGSVGEEKFLQLCVRCGECIKVCPSNVLQPAGFEGAVGLWTPKVVADWSGCEPTCNNCGQVCPTGAIRALELEEKRVARMGLAVVNERTCLPYAGTEQCQLCVDECRMAGYEAIEFLLVNSEIDEQGRPLEGTGFLAPVVLEDKCVGCGLCQMRCHSINVKNNKTLAESAIRVVAGPGKEDRLLSGSYIELRQRRIMEKRRARKKPDEAISDDYLPDFLK